MSRVAAGAAAGAGAEWDVVVAGGGAVAAATALAAASAGLRVQQVQVGAARAVRGRRYALSRRSVNFLQRLGVAPPMLQVAGFHLFAGGRWHGVCTEGEPVCVMVEEADLAQSLASARTAQNIPDLAVEELHWQHTAEDAVHLRADDAPLRARLLVVADGAASPLARQLGITTAPLASAHQRAFVAQVRAPALRADAAYQWFAQEDILALLPAGGGEFSMVWSTAHPPDNMDATALQQRTGLADIALCKGEVARAFPLRPQMRAARVAPRTALLGDAAGVVHPLAGQGLNLGLADAETLLQCTAQRLEKNTALALAAYSQTRTRRHWQMQNLTRLLTNARPASVLLGLAKVPILQRLAVGFANG